MSRAFVKESDEGGEAEIPLPQRDHPNYITPTGFANLQARLSALYAAETEAGEESSGIDTSTQSEERRRELRLLEYLVQTSQVIPAPDPGSTEVRFGAWVTLSAGGAEPQTVHIVGADELCVERGEISWVSPLARALLGRRAGDRSLWERPDGLIEVEILNVRYAP